MVQVFLWPLGRLSCRIGLAGKYIPRVVFAFTGILGLNQDSFNLLVLSLSTLAPV